MIDRLLREDAKPTARHKNREPSSSESDTTGHSKKMRRKKKSSTQTVFVVGQPTRPVQRRLVLGGEEHNTAAEEVTLANLLVAQPIITKNPGTFVGVPEDKEIEDLTYPGFRAILHSGFHFDPQLPIDHNKKRVHEWRNRTRAQTPPPIIKLQRPLCGRLLHHPLSPGVENIEIIAQVSIFTFPLIFDLPELGRQGSVEEEAKVVALHPYMHMSDRLVTVRDYILAEPEVSFVVGTNLALLEDHKALNPSLS